MIFLSFSNQNIHFNFDSSFFYLAKNEMNGRCMEIDFHFQFLVLDGNRKDEKPHRTIIKELFLLPQLSIVNFCNLGVRREGTSVIDLGSTRHLLIISSVINWKPS